MSEPSNTRNQFDWRPQPKAATLIDEILDDFVLRCPPLGQFGEDVHEKTGTRLIDWIDHVAIPAEEAFGANLADAGFIPRKDVVWHHPDGVFPEIHLHHEPTWRAAIKVDSVANFVRNFAAKFAGAKSVASNLSTIEIEGQPLAPLRKAKIATHVRAELWVVERHGYLDWDLAEITPDQEEAVAAHQRAFRERRRAFDDPAAGFDRAMELIRAAVDDLGVDWACDLFFAAEREYWASRNRAARVQKARQDAMGLGWANHDHHTFRSSREQFGRLIAALEALGLLCRERFYAGEEAGWGAQVLEQPVTGICVFADVDLAPEEVAGDFAHAGLAKSDQLGTVGLWCRLHGDAFLEAGMHHLECCFDFTAATEQLARFDVITMDPFVDLPYLRQAFTRGEMWPVDANRIDAALSEGEITEGQAERFRTSGALGSHMEILERRDGYKGFDQSGISGIIRDTDPRLSSVSQ